MTGAERGFLLLTSQLGNPERNPLTVAQLRTLAQRVQASSVPVQNRDLEIRDLLQLGCGSDMAQRILSLLREEDLLEHYLQKGRRAGCIPLTRRTPGYPVRVRRLAPDAPGCLWFKGDPSLLHSPAVALVGSRELNAPNAAFARAVGYQAAKQGYVLVSGNARGADRAAQEGALEAGGSVISVVADALMQQPERERVLFLSEDGFDLSFSAMRALSRNRVIHALGHCTLVAQSNAGSGGTWSGTVRNLKHGWSPVFCYQDGSEAVRRLCSLGATPILPEALADFSLLIREEPNFFQF